MTLRSSAKSCDFRDRAVVPALTTSARARRRCASSVQASVTVGGNPCRDDSLRRTARALNGPRQRDAACRCRRLRRRIDVLRTMRTRFSLGSDSARCGRLDRTLRAIENHRSVQSSWPRCSGSTARSAEDEQLSIRVDRSSLGRRCRSRQGAGDERRSLQRTGIGRRRQPEPAMTVYRCLPRTPEPSERLRRAN